MREIISGGPSTWARPRPASALFEEFEEVVTGQMFVFLDELQEKIGAWDIKAVFDDGPAIDIQDLQVFPGTGDVSFRLASVPVSASRRD